ncbi:MAG TPA: radical SAM protein, partial [Spirochaetes bacterium]|nr:radical SAM protein [Spirochaetota bacterium]
MLNFFGEEENLIKVVKESGASVKTSFSIKTLGCKLNQYETSVIVHHLLRRGWQIRPFGDKVDVVIVNTCTVTDRSDKKCRNYIRQGARLSRLGGAVVTGCLAERDAEGLMAMPEVLAVYGNREKDLLHEKLMDLVVGFEKVGSEPLFAEKSAPGAEVGSEHAAAGPALDEADDETCSLPLGHTRGFLKIQDGCDGRCSYCIVPAVRGAPRSRDREEVLRHARALVETGCPELVLTGITIGT